ncbi:MAG: ABC transporter substrate-binding protein, partial [Gammaproteobacteria bacterium]|nr:ABC transporter substrate-binding protein [Gammaproteobacteria bacterium]
MLKRIKTVLLVMALWMSASVAWAEHPAQELVEQAIGQMVAFLDENKDAVKKDPALLDAKVNELFVKHIDFDTMTKLTVGKHWKKATAEQRTDLVVEFQNMLLGTYTQALTEYSGETMDFEPFRPENREDRAVVRSTFNQANGSKVPVVYKLREKNGWKIYDIVVESLSLVTSYRP